MNKKVSLGIVILGLIAGCIAYAALPASAATSNTDPGQALEIAPPLITLNADPGKTVKTQINLRNISSGKLIVKGQLNDFIAAGEDGTPKIILDDTEAPNPFSLKGWITTLPTLTMNSKELKTLTVTINVPANAAPGGHYGVVRFTATPPELEGQGVSLSTSLGALLLITVNGQASEKLSIDSFGVSHRGKSTGIFESTPLDFTERLKNSGNIHLQPAGHISITDMFGHKIANVNINLPPRNILPQSIRRFEQKLDESTLGKRHLFGKYTADLLVTYGASKHTAVASLTFWVIPYRLIAAVIVAVIIGFFALRFLVRRYNERIIRNASGRR